MNLRYVLTGSPGSGKTTLLKSLEKFGYKYISESARYIIKERKEKGLSPRPKLNEFALDILNLDIEKYNNLKNLDKPVFFDRGIIDALSLVYEFSNFTKDKIEEYIKKYKYNRKVFILPPWEEIYCTDNERDQNYPESIEVYNKLYEWYRYWNYKVIEIPKVSINERIDFILENVESIT